MTKVLKKDYEKFYVLDPEPEFSPEHNKRAIENSIKRYELRRKQEMDTFREGVGERSDMVATYLKSNAAQSNKPIDKFLGKTIMARLRGEQIIDRLKMLSKPSYTMSDVAKIARERPTARVHAQKQ
jgi:acyl-CoA hydrolase